MQFCSFAVSNNGGHNKRHGTAKREREWEREDTRHGSRWRIKPQTRQRHWQPAAGHQSQSFCLSLCPSACRCDDFEARRGHMRVSQVHFALAVQKFNQEVQRARRVQHPQAASSYFPLPALSSPSFSPSHSFSAPPPHKTCLGQQHAPAPCV